MSEQNKIDRSIAKAEQIKAQENKKTQKIHLQKQKVQKPKWYEKEENPDPTFAFYAAMNPTKPGNIWFLFLSIFVLGSEVLWFFDSFGHNYYYFIPLAFGILWAGRYLFSWIYIAVTFQHFKNWQKKLPFVVKGWDQFLNTTHDFTQFFWRVNCKIKINFKGNYQLQQKAIDSMCYLFTVKTSKYFYSNEGAPVAGYAQDPRKQWTASNGVLEGSSNINVVRDIYYFIKNDLKLLANEYQIIESVEITVDPEESKIQTYFPHDWRRLVW